MNTRRSADDLIFHQCGPASSPSYERGVMSNLVARRSMKLKREDQDLLFFVQYLTHQPGELSALLDYLLKTNLHLGTPSMREIEKQTGQNYTAAEVVKIRKELPDDEAFKFPLYGEADGEAKRENHRHRRALESAIRSKELMEMDDGTCHGSESYNERLAKLDAEDARLADDSKNHPDCYPVGAFFEICRKAALTSASTVGGISSLEKELYRLCVDIDCDLERGPWYYSGLVNALREYQHNWKDEKSNVYVTKVGKVVHETLEYTIEAGILSLMTSNASVGQSFAALRWCETNAGRARFCDVPPSNDDASFYRAIARALGLGNYLNYKNVQIRERVEYVLQTSGLCMVLNHAENLWPQKNLREAFPGRLAWLFDQVSKGACACMIAGPQFFKQQRTCEKTGWDSPEFRKKIDHLVRLPDALDVADLTAIAQVMLPEAGQKLQEAVAIYAVGQQRDLAAVEAVSKRADFLARRAGRAQSNKEDIVSALKFVSESDKLLREVFVSSARPPKPQTRIISDQAVIPEEEKQRGFAESARMDLRQINDAHSPGCVPGSGTSVRGNPQINSCSQVLKNHC
jgi:hypothetical protein